MKNLWSSLNYNKLSFFPYIFLSILIVVFLSLGQTIESYFWIDDNAVIYKLQHLDENIGYWGKGIFGEGPYRHIIDQFVLFYPLFGINPQPYFGVGILLYLFAAFTLYFFIKSIVKEKSVAIIAAFIFGTGYFGLESILGITNSWQTSRGVIMALVTFWLYYKYLEKRKLIFYTLSVLLFYFSLETAFIRAHGLIIALVFLDLIYSSTKLNIQKIARFILRLLPFVYIYYYIYLTSLGYAQELGIWKIYKDVIDSGKLHLLTIPIQDLGNLFIPDNITSLLDKFLHKYLHILLPDEFSLGSFISGLLYLLVNFLLIFIFFKKEKNIIKLLFFSFIWVGANFVGFYARESSHTLWSTHRYFSYSFAGIAIFWGCLFYLLGKTKLDRAVLVAAFILIGMLSLFSIKHIYKFNVERNIPAKQLFADFKTAIPNLDKGSIIYITIENDSRVSKRYGSFFGGMFSEGANYAIYYPGIDYMYDFLITYNFNDVLTSLNKKDVSIDKVYTFYYGFNGLKNTTSLTRDLLSKKMEIYEDLGVLNSNTRNFISNGVFSTATLVEKKGDKYLGVSPVITLNPEELASLVPVKLSFDIKLEPLYPSLPYVTKTEELNIDPKEKLNIYSFLVSQKDLKRETEASAASFWKDQKPQLIMDDRLETAWRGHRGFWDDLSRQKTNNKEFLLFNFGKEVEISMVRWVSAQPPLIPISYRYLGSLDGIIWENLGEIRRNEKLNPDTVIADEINSKAIKYLKLEIDATYGNDGPEIKEIEFIEKRFKDIDFDKAEKLSKQPFWEINNYEELESAFETVSNNSIKFYYQSDVDKNQDRVKYIELPISLDGQFHKKSLDLPAMGENWANFYIEDINFPCAVYIRNVKYEYGL